MAESYFSAVCATVCVAAVLFLSACAPKTVPAPVVTGPKFPDFIRPLVPAAMTRTPAESFTSRGWTALQAGDFKTAQRDFETALTTMPEFYPAETSLGYLELARKDAKAALPHFDRALELNAPPGDVAMLYGRGTALLALNREADALSAFEAVVAADPSQTELARRVEVLKFRNVEQGLARARNAARGGRLDEAAQAYATAIASSPDSAFLYRELAGVERRKGDADAALEHFRHAVALDASDVASLTQLGEMLEARGDVEEAEKVYGDALALEPSADLEKKLEGVRARTALARLPAEYRAIDQAAQITRGDLAALIGIRLSPMLTATRRGDAALITDVRTHWAAIWIMQVARAGVMEPFANHAFQPRTVVHRSDLAQAVARLLMRLGTPNNGQVKGWESARLKFSDLSPSHLAYPAASMAVASGVMKNAADDAFQPSRTVTGAEAIDVMAKLGALAGLK